MALTRLDQLQALQQRIPVASQQLANQYKAGRDIQMQQAVGSVAPGGVSKDTVAKLGAAQVGQAGQQAIKTQAQNVQQVGEVQKTQLSEEASLAQQRLAGKQLTLEDKQRRLDKQLNQVSSDVKQELFDKQMKFEQTKAGDTYMNTRQLTDWAKLKATNEEQFKTYQSNMNMLMDRQMQVFNQAYKRISQALESESALARLEVAGVSRADMEQYKKGLEMQMKQMTSEAANKQAVWSSGGMIIGAVAGGVIGGIYSGGAGAAAGVAAGGAIGGGAGSFAAES